MARLGATRKQLLDAACALFGRKGYHATGINQVLDEAGAPKGVLYFHFPGGKQQLAAEAVAQNADALGTALEAVLADAPDPAAALRMFADLLGTSLEQSDFRDGCPITTVAADADSALVLQACTEGYDRLLTPIADYLIAHGAERDNADEMAIVALSSLEGALLLAKTRRDTGPLHTVAARLALIVDKALAG